MTETSKEVILAEIRKLSEKLSIEGKEVTRKVWRDSTQRKDSDFEKHFGTWTEFVSSAGLAHSKEHKNLLSKISNHASQERLKIFSIEKNSLADKYTKPSNKRFQTIVSGSDIHGNLVDPFYYRVFIDTIKRIKPDKVILPGDILDMPNFSSYTQDPRNYEPHKEFVWLDKFLGDIRKYAGADCEIIYIEGNHEARFLKYVLSGAPTMLSVLNDVHGMTVSSLLGCDKYEVKYIGKLDLTTFTEMDVKKGIAKNYYIANDSVLFHHFPAAKNWGLNCQTGHHHTIKVDTFFDAVRGPLLWVQPGCGHIRNTSFSMGEKYQNGFCIWHIDTHTKKAFPEIINVTNDYTVVGGKYYTRTEDEEYNLW